MSWEDDALEIRLRREETLATLEEQAERLAQAVTVSHVVTPAMAADGCFVLQTLANLRALKRAHLRSVAG